MVMAESERATVPDTNNSTTTARLQWLRQRREALQEKLIRKNNELKNLCIDEAEITGVLPPEIPLDPGESPPIFRKRIATCITYPQNIINKLKTSQVEESTLELERQVQTGIAKSAYAIVNDPVQTKSVRRKHRQIYQQSQKRLKELEIRLNFIRQGYGQLARRSNPPENWHSSSQTSINDDNNSIGKISAKHRTKKPRPPLESTTDKEPGTSKIIDKSGVIERNIIHQEIDGTQFDVYRSKSRYTKHSRCSPIDHNENPDHSIFPDYRARTHSHGNIEDQNIRHLRNSQFEERPPYRNAPSMYNLDTESRVSSDSQQHWQQRKYLDPGYIQSHRMHQNEQYNKQPQIKPHRFYYQDRLSPLDKTSIQSFGSDISDEINPRNPMPHYRLNHPRLPDHVYPGNIDSSKESLILRQENDIIQEKMTRRNVNESVTMPRHKITNNDNWSSPVDDGMWYPDNHYQQEKFGSLDRRKHILHQSMKENPSPPMKHPVNSQQHRQQIDQLPPPPLPPPPQTRILLRTQSLGSVEKWHPGAVPLPSQHPSEAIESPTGSSSCRDPYGRNRGLREKEWYETSMDYGYQIPPPNAIIENSPKNIPRMNPHSTIHAGYPRSSPSPSSISSSPKPLPPPPTPPLPTSSPSFNESSTKREFSKSEKDLEIPAESSNHIGKYQSYREVTKPFEMSDFYKYSTKFRKKQEHVGHLRPVEHQSNFNGNDSNVNFTNNNANVEEGNTVTRRPPISGNFISVQRRGYEGRQPYPPTRTNGDIKEWSGHEQSTAPQNDSTVV